MSHRAFLGLIAGGLLGVGMFAVQPALAAVPLSGFAGSTASSVPGCPFIIWRLANAPNGEVHGFATYSDLSGVSVVTGTMEKDGTFDLTLKKTSLGNGPVGEVKGTAASNGHIVAKLVGQGCANNDVDIPPDPSLNKFRAVGPRD